VNHLSVTKCRSPCRVAHSKATRGEQDDDCSSSDEEPVSGGSESSTDASNYSEEDSVSCDSKEESGEEPTDAEEEFNGKGLISTPVSRKGVTSDYDTPIADLLRHNRSAKKNVM
jgi:hypothetical protein